MAYSTQRAVSDGTMAYLDLSIDYIKRADINVFYDGLPADPTTWSWVGTTDKRIAFSPVIANGVEVLLKRTTQISDMINVFSNGAKFNNATMDLDFTQLLYLNQEAVEGAALTDIFNNVDFHGFLIKNLGAAVDDTDAISYGQVKSLSNGAYTSAQAAAASATAAGTSSTLAQAWATQLTTPVSGSDYSSKQYALNSAASATASGNSASAASTSAGQAATSASNADASASSAADSAADAEAAAAPATALIAQVDAATATANAASTTAGTANTNASAAVTTANAAATSVATALQKSANLSDVVTPITASKNIKVGRILLSDTTVVNQGLQTVTFPGGFDDYDIEFDRMILDTTHTGATPVVQLIDASGVLGSATYYQNNQVMSASGSGPLTFTANTVSAATYLALGFALPNDTATPGPNTSHIHIQIRDVLTANRYTMLKYEQDGINNLGSIVMVRGNGMVLVQSAKLGLRITTVGVSGALLNGRLRLYGLL